MEFHDPALVAGTRPGLLAKVRKGPLEVSDVVVLDLSLAGCMLDWQAWRLTEAQRVMVSLPGVSNLPSTVLWIEGDRVGLEFDDLLHQAVYDHLHQRLG